MRTAHIAGLADDRTKAVMAPVSDALAADGWRVETSPTTEPTGDLAGLALSIIVTCADDVLERHATELMSRTALTDDASLLVRIALRPAEKPASLPSLIGPISSHDAIRKVALALAPGTRVNAITADQTRVAPADLGREISAALTLFIGSPAMTGVTIPLDTTALARYAAATSQRQETSHPS